MQPLALLAKWPIKRRKPKSTSPSGVITAALSCAKALTKCGLRCIVSTLLGVKPSVPRKKSKWDFSSGVVSGLKGFNRDMMAPLLHTV